MAKTIYLEYDEEVLGALEKLIKSGNEEVVLVVPAGGRIFRNLTGLRLLRREAEKYQKKLSIATADERGRLLVRRAGITLAQNSSQSGALGGVSNATRRPRAGMGDIAARPVKSSSKKPAELSASAPAPIPDSDGSSDLAQLIGPEHQSAPITLPEPVKVPRLSYKYTVLPAAAFLIVLFLVGFFVLPKARVRVVARTEPIIRDLEMQVNSAVSVPDVQNLVIPGKRLTEGVSVSESFPATGAKNLGEKASGFVTLYNFSKNSLILKSSTTRLVASGKTFFFLSDVGSIRPTARIGTDLEVDQSSLIDPVPIVAEFPGDEYNFSSNTRFEIHNEVFGHQPEVLYAVNANPVAGGTKKEVKIISAADLEKARATLAGKIGEQVRQNLLKTAPPEIKLLENAFSIQVAEEQTDRKVGEEAETFQLSQKTVVAALAFSETDVRDLIVERIVRLLPENKYLLPVEEQKLTEQFVSLDLSGGVGTLRAHFESEVRYQINTDFLLQSLPGKTATQVKEILLSRPEIEDIDVDLSPFWVKTVPRFTSKIDFKIQQ